MNSIQIARFIFVGSWRPRHHLDMLGDISGRNSKENDLFQLYRADLRPRFDLVQEIYASERYDRWNR